MPKHLVWLALCACFGLSACATVQPAAKACANWRWIGLKSSPAAPCPQVPGWKEEQLFPKLRPFEPEQKGYDQQHYLSENQDPGKPSTAEVIQELDRFCRYEREDKKVRVFPFPAPAGLVKVDKDCAAISSSAYTGPTKKDLENASMFFLEQAGRPKLQINNQLGVRLAFLDTQPTGMGVSTAPGNSHHGYTLTHIARQLVCSPETSNRCAAQITTRLALPITRFNAKHRKRTRTDLVRGGYIGMQGDLAQAITNEVDDWQNEGSQEHLVLNLSVGWDEQLFDGLKTERITELRAGTQAVYQALRYAASYDVLVLAAAGNQKACAKSTDGPLLPAAWEGTKTDEHLLYAVGGVRSNGYPLSNARHRGMPQLAAYGEVVGVTSWDPERYTAFYTGSSVATAVVSSIAAVVWDSFPDRTPSQVMQILYDGGRDLNFPADFWFGGGTAPIARRLSLCSALAEACKNLAPCPLKSACVPWTPEEPVPLQWASALSAKPTGKSCHPWMHPQPDDPPCLNCHEPPPR